MKKKKDCDDGNNHYKSRKPTIVSLRFCVFVANGRTYRGIAIIIHSIRVIINLNGLLFGFLISISFCLPL